MKTLEIFEDEELLLLLKKKIYSVQQTHVLSVQVSKVYRIVYNPLKGLNCRILELAGDESKEDS
jgi:hypothetical protein